MLYVIVSFTNTKLGTQEITNQSEVITVDDLGKIDKGPRQPKLEVRLFLFIQNV